jgi:hypothetical protein
MVNVTKPKKELIIQLQNVNLFKFWCGHCGLNFALGQIITILDVLGG